MYETSTRRYWSRAPSPTPRPLFIDADILPVSFMYYKTVASLMLDINSNNSPTNLNLVKSSKLEIHKNSLSPFGVKLWNEIPCHIRDLPEKKFTKVLHRLLSDILKKEVNLM